MTPEQKPDSMFWLELFFDLVAVAAMVVLATTLEHDPTWAGIGVFAVTFTAIWLSWSALAFYVNVANELAEQRTIIAGMAAIAVMAASLLHLGDHANVFAAAFIICRIFTAAATRRTGRTVVSWSLLAGGATTPWIVSLWVPGPLKYLLWAFGLVIDLFGQLQSRKTAEIHELRRRRRDRGEDRRPELVAAPLREHHLIDRLGTFVIIVLGESVLQLVRASSETEWDAGMWLTAGVAFIIVVAIWRQFFTYGFTSAPGGSDLEDRLPVMMLIHLTTTGSLVVLAAGLGEMVRHPSHHVEPAWAAITAGALVAYLVTSTLAGVLTGAPRRWLFGWALPSTAAALALVFVGPHLSGQWFVALLAVPVVWEVLYGRRLPA